MQAGTGIRYTLAGVPAEVDRIGVADMVAFERHFDLPASVLEPESSLNPNTGETELVGTYRIEWMMFMVWRSARRLNLIEKTAPFDDDFLEQVEDFGVDNAEVTEVGESGPLDPTPSPG